ncbi:MAG: hypothetical protein ISS66_01090 [Desulfobacteraceae bacterium]|nr:hypothetical protein [Desulfobacteraceae bacterium]
MNNYERLKELIGTGSYDQLRNSYKGWIDEYLGGGMKNRQDEWTRSIAVGSRSFIENVKALLGFRAKGRRVIEGSEAYHLREGSAHSGAFFGGENENIGIENIYFLDVNIE